MGTAWQKFQTQKYGLCGKFQTEIYRPSTTINQLKYIALIQP